MRSPVSVTTLADERWFLVGSQLVGVGPRQSRVFSRHRDLDWWMALFALLVGAWLLWPGVEVAVGTEGAWTRAISSLTWGKILVGIAILRFVALKLNGHWQTGGSALIRAGAATIAMLFWGQVAYVTVQADLTMFREAMAAGVLRSPVGFAGTVLLWAWTADARCCVRSLDDMISIRRARRMARAVGGGDGHR